MVGNPERRHGNEISGESQARLITMNTSGWLNRPSKKFMRADLGYRTIWNTSLKILVNTYPSLLAPMLRMSSQRVQLLARWSKPICWGTGASFGFPVTCISGSPASTSAPINLHPGASPWILAPWWPEFVLLCIPKIANSWLIGTLPQPRSILIGWARLSSF